MPGRGIEGFKLTSKQLREARFPFSEERLQGIFASPVYTGCKSRWRRSKKGDLVIRDGRFWIPLIGLYSGMRLGEIVQLLATDLKYRNGVLYFDVARAEEENKQIKTYASVRQVPVHKVLIEAEFEAHIEAARKQQPKGRLFPDINPSKKGYFSDNFSKWFSGYATAIGIKTDKTCFHSFRHNFKDALALSQVPEAIAKALMGHADQSVHGAYGSEFPIKVLDEYLQRISYQLDLQHIVKASSSVHASPAAIEGASL